MSASEESSPENRSTAVPEEERSDSVEKVASIDDLLIEILGRLPIKSLIKFKCVSKHWLSHITDPVFCRRLSIKPASVSGLFLQEYLSSIDHPDPKSFFLSLGGAPQDSRPSRFLRSSRNPPGMRIIQSCNGLLLCCSSKGSSRDRMYHVYNPTTKHCTTLPRLQVKCADPIILGISMAFDPIISHHYKVVCVRGLDNLGGYFQVEIYSSDEGAWRHSGRPFHVAPLTSFGNGVYWNGAVHWFCPWGPSMYFHIETERRKEMVMPPIPEGRGMREICYSGESRGHLHLIEINEILTAHVYEMETDRSKWSVRYRLNLARIFREFHDMFQAYHDGEFSILCLVRGQHSEEESCLVVNVYGRIVLYNLSKKTLTELCYISLGDGISSQHIPSCLSFVAYQYVESLSFV